MLQAANTVAKAHNIECQNLAFPLQNKPEKSVKARLRIFIFRIFGTNYWITLDEEKTVSVSVLLTEELSVLM